MAEKRKWVSYARQEYELSEGKACELLEISRSVYRYEAKRDDQEVSQVLQALALKYPRWGFWKLYQFLRNQGRPECVKKLRQISEKN